MLPVLLIYSFIFLQILLLDHWHMGYYLFPSYGSLLLAWRVVKPIFAFVLVLFCLSRKVIINIKRYIIVGELAMGLSLPLYGHDPTGRGLFPTEIGTIRILVSG